MLTWAGEVAPSLSAAKLSPRFESRVQCRCNLTFLRSTLQWKNKEIQGELIIWLVAGTDIRVFVEMTLVSCALPVSKLTLQMWISPKNIESIQFVFPKSEKKTRKYKLILIQERRNYDVTVSRRNNFIRSSIFHLNNKWKNSVLTFVQSCNGINHFLLHNIISESVEGSGKL